MSNSSDRGTEYAGNDMERAKRPISSEEQARAVRREGLANSNSRSYKRQKDS